MEKKYIFEKPELEIIEFTNDDIITDSGDFGDINQGGTDIFPKPNPNGWW